MELKIISNPDIEIYNQVTEAVIKNNNYCPCMLEKTDDTKCICKEFREQKNEGLCHCQRFKKYQYNIRRLLI